jgi:peptide-methionine (S)-S-oxide reductase
MADAQTPIVAPQIATLGGGCFWCLEAAFLELRGVERVESGYAGGQVDNPTYQQVCRGDTGHAEVVQITFDPAAVSYEDLLRVFFTIHDPTTLNRQVADVGTQYRSVIFYHTPEQKEAAELVLEEVAASDQWPGKLVTQLLPAPKFYKAEEYHHDYYNNNPEQPYCRAVVAPKVAKVRKEFFEKLKR